MRRISVLDFANQIGAASDDIPVVVKFGSDVVGTFNSLFRLASKAAPGILEAKINFVTLTREEITIQASQREYSTKRP